MTKSTAWRIWVPLRARLWRQGHGLYPASPAGLVLRSRPVGSDLRAWHRFWTDDEQPFRNPVREGLPTNQDGQLFGTRYQGNTPLLNSNDTLRIGWSYIGRTGEYVFRIGGEALNFLGNPHINLWPPSWWFGP